MHVRGQDSDRIEEIKTNLSGETIVAIIGLPQAGADVAVGVRDPAESGDGEPHGKVRDVVGEHAGGVGDPDSALGTW